MQVSWLAFRDAGQLSLRSVFLCAQRRSTAKNQAGKVVLTEVPEDSSGGLGLCVRGAKRPAKGQVSPDAPFDTDNEVTVVCIFQPELQV